MMSYFNVCILRLATGITLLLKRKARPLRKIVTIKIGRMNRNKGMPADLIATSSKDSPRLPKVMMDDNRMASGKASGTTVAATYAINFPMVTISTPLPTISSIYNQKNCSTSTKSVIKKVAMNGPMNALRMSLSSFLITLLT